MGIKNLKLYIRFPVKIEEELQVKNLHPDIVKVILPRQKSRRWCIVEFETSSKLENATSALKIIEIGGKKLKLKPFIVRQKRSKAEVSQSSVTSTQNLLTLLDRPSN